ncbi:MAG: hypothetical protein WAP52_03815 [Candidatus Sungiibacteriota bacterium]
MIKKLVRGNGEKLILVENDEPEAVVMSFTEYSRLTGTGTGAGVGSTANAAPAGAAPVSLHLPVMPAQLPREADHATDEQFDMPLYDEGYKSEDAGEMEMMFDEWQKPEPASHETTIRLADIRLEDLPI